MERETCAQPRKPRANFEKKASRRLKLRDWIWQEGERGVVREKETIVLPLINLVPRAIHWLEKLAGALGVGKNENEIFCQRLTYDEITYYLANFLRIRINFLRHFDPFDPLKHSALVIILLILITFSVDVGHSWEKRRGDEIEVG